MEIEMLEKPIRDFSHKSYTREEVIEQIKEFDGLGYSIYIGSDSQIIKKKVSIVTCICLWKEDTGSKIFFTKEGLGKKIYPSLWSRMELETLRSIETAAEIEEFVNGKIIIHLDLGTDIISSRSATYWKVLRSRVEAQGFECEVKPNSWAASGVADKVVKG
jgi:predicted RNase H-related nuclease YkuK (DUF458 family)